jgi:hypothetical protein
VKRSAAHDEEEGEESESRAMHPTMLSILPVVFLLWERQLTVEEPGVQAV